MRAVVVSLIALPVVVGGLGIAAAVVALGPTPISSTADRDLTAASAVPGADWPDSHGGTAIDGSRPHLTVSDGTRTLALPGAIPAMLSILPSPAFDLPPLAPKLSGQDDGAPGEAAPTARPGIGPADGPTAAGGRGTASAEGLGSAGALNPSFGDRTAGGPSRAADRPSPLTASPRPPIGLDRHDSRMTSGDFSPVIEAPRDAGPGRGEGRPDASHPGTERPGANRPPAHADDRGRPDHADTTGPPPHASDNGNSRGGNQSDNRGGSGPGGPGGPGGRDRDGGRSGGWSPDNRSTPR